MEGTLQIMTKNEGVLIVKAFINDISYYIFIFILICITIQFLWNSIPWFRDDTDKQGWFQPRSGVKIITDELTQCQYLVTAGGGITPRIVFGNEHMNCLQSPLRQEKEQKSKFQRVKI